MSDGSPIIALVATHNEGDIISHVVGDLIRQGVSVYLIDDGSTDDTVAAAAVHLDRGLIGIERRPPSPTFDWAGILRRKQELAATLEADWFIHHDADEFRESPWPSLQLGDAIRRVDDLGYNAIDFMVLNFRPTDEESLGQRDVRDVFRFYEPASPWDRLQVKAWRKQPQAVDLVSSGGHEVLFPNRRICPIRFLVRHYPIRSQVHGERKVFVERKPRFAPVERARGWHVQYEALAPGTRFVRDPTTLMEFDADAVRADLALHHRDSSTLAAVDLEASALRARCAALETDLAAREADTARLAIAFDTDRQRLAGELAHLRAALDERESDNARMVREFADQRQHLVENLNEARRRLTTREAETERLEREILAQRTVADDERWVDHGRIEAYATEADRARREVLAIRASKSWRVTAPLRAAHRIVIRPPAPDQPPKPTDARGNSRPVNWGDLARVSPFSQHWGLDRGTPVDRHYIELFLRSHYEDVAGRVLEVKDNGYTRMFGGGRVAQSDVVDKDASNPHATIVADLAAPGAIPPGQFDCFILTQTLHIIYDCRAALEQAARLLKPGGVLLCTIPAVSRVSDEDGGLESGDYWRLTQAAVRRLFAGAFRPDDIEIATYGNVRACAAFLYGLAAEELTERDLNVTDPWFPLIHCIRAVRRDD